MGGVVGLWSSDYAELFEVEDLSSFRRAGKDGKRYHNVYKMTLTRRDISRRNVGVDHRAHFLHERQSNPAFTKNR